MKFGLYGLQPGGSPYSVRVVDGTVQKINYQEIIRTANCPSEVWEMVMAARGYPIALDRGDLRPVPLYDSRAEARFNCGVPDAVQLYGLDCEPFFPSDRREWREQQERIKLYMSYGILGREKRTVYTVGRPAGDINEQADFLLPSGWKKSENAGGEPLFIDPDGVTWLANEVLTTWGNAPALVWFDGRSQRRAILRRCEPNIVNPTWRSRGQKGKQDG